MPNMLDPSACRPSLCFLVVSLDKNLFFASHEEGIDISPLGRLHVFVHHSAPPRTSAVRKWLGLVSTV